MKKLLIGLIVLVTLLSVPMAVSAISASETMTVTADVITAITVTPTGAPYCTDPWTGTVAAGWEMDPDQTASHSCNYGTVDVAVGSSTIGWGITVADQNTGDNTGYMLLVAGATDAMTNPLQIYDEVGTPGYVNVNSGGSIYTGIGSTGATDKTIALRQVPVTADTDGDYSIVLVFTVNTA